MFHINHVFTTEIPLPVYRAEREFLIPCVPCCAKAPGMTVCSTGSKEGGKCSTASAEAQPVALSRQRTWIPYRDPQLEYRHALEW